jgi:hypothetical protein
VKPGWTGKSIVKRGRRIWCGGGLRNNSPEDYRFNLKYNPEISALPSSLMLSIDLSPVLD